MTGTRSRPTRCVALAGEIGRRLACTIYARRPSVCREVAASWEFGQPSPQCERARAAYDLAPLTPADRSSAEANDSDFGSPDTPIEV